MSFRVGFAFSSATGGSDVVGRAQDDVVDEPVVDVDQVGHEGRDVAAQRCRVAANHVLFGHVRRVRLPHD